MERQRGTVKRYQKKKLAPRTTAPDGGPLRVAIYCRVSTDEQAEKGYSLRDQEAKAVARATALGWRLVRIDRDNFTGTKAERPAFDQLVLAAARGEIDAVLAWNGDRLGRGEMLVICRWMLERHGVRVDYVEVPREDTLQGRQMEGMKGFFSQVELDTLRTRAHNGRERKAREGKRITGRAPFGYQLDPQRKGYLLIEPTAAELVRKIFAWLVYEQRSLRWIAIELTRRGVPQWRGRTWAATAVRTILRNRVYIGKHRCMGRADLEIDVPLILTASLWQEAQAALARNRKIFAGRPPLDPGFLLRGIIEHDCGRRMHCRMTKGTRFYECPNREEPHRYAHAEKLEARVWQRIVQTWDDPVESEAFARRVAGYQDKRAAKDVEVQSAVAFLHGEDAKETSVIERLIRILRKPDAPEELGEELAAAKRRRDAVRARLDDAEARVAQHGRMLPESEIRALCQRYETLVRGAKTPAHKAALLRSALTRIVYGTASIHLDGILPWHGDSHCSTDGLALNNIEKNRSIDGLELHNTLPVSLDYRVSVERA